MLDGYGERMCSLKTKQKTWESMSPEERDTLVCRKVMQWREAETPLDSLKAHEDTIFYVHSAQGVLILTRSVYLGQFHPSTSTVTAFIVLGKFDNWRIEGSKNGYGVFIGQNDDFDASLPAAICRCALRAKGIEV